MSKKIYPNAPCPCGSGLKFKTCRCTKYHPGTKNIRTEDFMIKDERLKGLEMLNLPTEVLEAYKRMISCCEHLYAIERQRASSLPSIAPLISKTNDIQASGYVQNDRPVVVISSGLFEKYIELVASRFPDELVSKYFKTYSGEDVRKKILNIIVDKTTLHEYYHWFRGHGYWEADHNVLPPDGSATENQMMLHNLNRQAVEYDADRYAINMLVKMMPNLRQDELTFILLAFLSITYRANYSQASGKGFDFSDYSDRLYLRAPLPALRYYYFEKYLSGLVKGREYDFDKAKDTALRIEQEISANLERTFLFTETAHTDKALTWHSKVVQRLCEIIPELRKDCVLDYLGEPGSWEYEFSDTDVKYTDEGAPIRK